MGRDAKKSKGNVWREARIRAAAYDETLYSRERVSDLIGVGIDAIRRIETDANKTMPVDTAVLMADLYNAPELLNYYCLNECPIGRHRSISSDVVNLDRVTVKLLQNLKIGDIREIKGKLLDIARDGVVDEEELPDLREILEFLEELSKTVSELKIIAEKAMKGIQV